MKKILITFFTVIVIMGMVIPVSAVESFVPYKTYEYNTQEESVTAPVGYLPQNRIYSDDIGLTLSLNNPTDMIFDEKDTVYILDSGNSRIVITDKDLHYKTSIDSFPSLSDRTVSEKFTGARGFAIDSEGNFYIADTDQNRIIITSPSGEVERIITRPNNALQSTDSPFDVTKILIDKKGRIYAIAQSINLGAMVFTPDGEFSNFFGSNEISTTSDIIINFIKRKFMTKKQIAGMQKVTPVTFSNFCIDDDGFIYTVTGTTDEKNMVRCLNFAGKNILKNSSSNAFGDLEWDRKLSEESVKTSLQDIFVDSSGFINLLDSARGRIFQYSSDGRLLTEFGLYGEQVGCFNSPCAIMEIDEKILVLDSVENCIHTFAPTEYIRDIHTAVSKLRDYKFEGSLESWEKILHKNTNSTFPYYGMGLTYDAKGDYASAMKYFKLADEHELYSNSFAQYRKSFLQTHYLQIIGVILLIATAVIITTSIYRKKHKDSAFKGMQRCESSSWLYPFYTLFHPVDGFEQLKEKNKGSYSVAVSIVLIWFLIETLSFFRTGFIFNVYRASDYNFIVSLFQTVGVFVLFTVSNWAISTLFDGKGRLKEIVCVVAYSLVPLLVAKAINVVLSNVLSVNEGAFMNIVSILGIVWTALILLLGLYSVHQYSVSGTVISIAVSVVGMIIIIFLGILFYTLIQQLLDFIASLGDELALR